MLQYAQEDNDSAVGQLHNNYNRLNSEILEQTLNPNTRTEGTQRSQLRMPKLELGNL